MNDLSNFSNSNLTMSSREIAERTGKRHDNVSRDIELLLNQCSEDPLKFEDIYRDAYGREQRGFSLPKNLCLTLVAGYSAPLRKAIIDRWIELESRPREVTKIELAQMVIESEQARIAAESALAIAEPKAKYFDAYVEAGSSLSFTEAAKALGHAPHKFIALLSADHAIYKRGKHWVAYQTHIDRGLFEVKVGAAGDHSFSQTRVTPAGMVWAANRFGRKEIEAPIE